MNNSLVGETRLVNLEVGHDGQVFRDEFLVGLLVRLVLLQESGQQLDLSVVEVSSEKDRMIRQYERERDRDREREGEGERDRDRDRERDLSCFRSLDSSLICPSSKCRLKRIG